MVLGLSHHRRAAHGWLLGLCTLAVGLVACALVLVPALGPVMSVVSAVRDGTLGWSALAPRWSLLGWSVLWAAAIALLATVMAWPAAWCVRRHGLALLCWLTLPVLVPSYLAYHAMGMHRAPLTRLGDLIESLAQPADLGGSGLTDLPVLVGRVLAVLGLALWVWPVALLSLAPSLLRLDEGLLDAARVSGASRIRTHLEVFRAVRSTVLRTLLLVTLVMLGSAVPMHLAQAPTYAITAWQSIILDPRSLAPWVATWPLAFLMAGLVSFLLWWHWRSWHASGSALLPRTDPDTDDQDTPRVYFGARAWQRGVRLTNVVTLCILCISTILPLLTYAIALRRWESLGQFWVVSRDAIATSALGACVVGVLGAGLGALCWCAAAHLPRTGGWSAWVLGGAGGLFLVGALTPGVMVGHAWALAVQNSDGLYDSIVPVILAHGTRFALLPACVGVLLALSEPPALRDARRLAAGQGAWAQLRAWMRAEARRGAMMLAALALTLACLSLHEVEASIVLQPPGIASLPQTLLAQLHFARQEEMSAGAVVVLTPAFGIALLAAVFGSWSVRRRRC